MLTHLAHPTSYSELHFEFETAGVNDLDNRRGHIFDDLRAVHFDIYPFVFVEIENRKCLFVVFLETVADDRFIVIAATGGYSPIQKPGN